MLDLNNNFKTILIKEYLCKKKSNDNEIYYKIREH